MPPVAGAFKSVDMGVLAALALSGAESGGLDVSYTGLKQSLREAVDRDPLDALVVTVAGGAFLFYLAEKDENPKCGTYWDALVYVSTCLSVGYADVFARTAAGKAIATALMAVGPALAARVLDPPERVVAMQSAKALAVQEAMVGTLESILAELRKGQQK